MAPGSMSNVDAIETGRRRDISFGGGTNVSHQACLFSQQQQQHRHKQGSVGTGVSAPAPSAAIRSPLETSRTQSQSSDGRSSWHVEQTPGPGGGEGSAEGFAGGMEGGSGGGGGSGARREGVSFNLSVSEFPHLAFLAQGAMCKCFLASGSPRFSEAVVLKMAIENGPREAERDLNSELSLLQNLSHPNLTALRGAGQTPKGKTFMAIEYLDRGTLRARMDAARGGLGFWPALRHATELASVMRYLHEEAIPGMCILHRDLKPDNLGFRGNVMKLFDLGLAKVIKRSEPGIDEFYHMSGEVGSLRYMSPEVASKLPYNEKADVHSFAVVLWELVTGWLPYAGLSPELFVFQAVQHGQRPLMQFGWDADFKALLSSCWAVDPRRRPGFAHIHEALVALVEEKGTFDDSGNSNASGTRGASAGGCCAPSASPRSPGIFSRLLPIRRKNKSGGGDVRGKDER